jgi:hypothetical protein
MPNSRSETKYRETGGLAAAYALQGKIDEARAALAAARRNNPTLTIKYLIRTAADFPALIDGLRKAGLPDE